MKHLLMTLFLIHTAEAGQGSVYETSLYTGTVAFFLLMLAIIIVQMRKSAKDKALLTEREEKITWLRQIHAENEHRHLQQVQEMEKENLKLTHTIEDLERKLKEGTKNQVVSKIEELRNRRATVEKRLSTEG
jgi:nicotinamide mononucleotide adenylyltransferase